MVNLMGNGKRNKRVEGYEELGRREKLGEEIKKKKKHEIGRAHV